MSYYYYFVYQTVILQKKEGYMNIFCMFIYVFIYILIWKIFYQGIFGLLTKV